MTLTADAPLGVLMLDTTFPRPPGDVGHPATWPFPVLFETIPKATSDVVVRGRVGEVLEATLAAARRLEERGAVGLITSCGFLAALQGELAAASPIPIATSALMQVPFVARCLPPERGVGVITYDARALTPAHLAAVGADPATPVAGLPEHGEFRGMIEGGRPYQVEALRSELMGTARRLLEVQPSLGAIVLECTNLPPFAGSLQRALRLPVYDVVTLGSWFRAGLVPCRFEPADSAMSRTA